MKFGKGISFLAAATAFIAFSTPSLATDIVTPQADFGLTGTQVLLPNDSFVSEDGRFRLTFQTDGNLVLYQGTTVLWASDTNLPITVQVPGAPAGYMMPNPAHPVKAVFQADGNFVVYHTNTPTKKALTPWSSDTDGHPNARLEVQNDGNVVIRDNGKVLWSSKTCCH